MKRVISAAHRVIAYAMLVAMVAEFFFAGMGVFHASSFAIHMLTGYAITFASFLLFLLSLAGLLGGARIGLSALLVALMMLQSLLVNVHQPFVEALHPLNGLAIVGVTVILARMGGTKNEH